MKKLSLLFIAFLFCPIFASAQQCASSQECDSGFFCERSSCSDLLGECQSKPDICLSEFNPVCGCDGTTYTNDCDRQRMGISKKHEGKCQQTCASDTECNTGFFCQKDGCNAPGGACIKKPATCTQEYVPVCGCNGQTYGNNCERQGAGVSRHYSGECPSSCTSSTDCLFGEYCKKDGCGNISGQCMNTPEMCPKNYNPVCGCNGKTYDNDCKRKKSSAGIAYEGECKKEKIPLENKDIPIKKISNTPESLGEGVDDPILLPTEEDLNPIDKESELKIELHQQALKDFHWLIGRIVSIGRRVAQALQFP